MATKKAEANASELKAKIEAARASIQRAIIAGDSTLKLREYLLELEAEQQKLNEAAAGQEASQAAAARRAQDELNQAATVLAESRHARLMLLSDKYRAPQRPSMSHA
ncbi:hypothetical protein R75465_07971 [Paraburkholderia aspalathi]|uniref:hypothetical protein n=1 Tax=Paraburkholderia aspalathi TaxID=1324617 RepID=UPI001B0A9547|nr:hypothetical protein [Paraburkholderia aspalathi]CAE6866160.1 hypothetical protein R75465_07971 [Paraburkholderia aspalathi]